MYSGDIYGVNGNPHVKCTRNSSVCINWQGSAGFRVWRCNSFVLLRDIRARDPFPIGGMLSSSFLLLCFSFLARLTINPARNWRRTVVPRVLVDANRFASLDRSRAEHNHSLEILFRNLVPKGRRHRSGAYALSFLPSFFFSLSLSLFRFVSVRQSTRIHEVLISTSQTAFLIFN